MNNKEKPLPDFLAIYERYQSLTPGQRAELRRCAKPEELSEVPAFYRLVSKESSIYGQRQFVFCLPLLTHKSDGPSLGQALGKQAGLSEKRMMMVLRSEAPNDLLQLRRLLAMCKPSVDIAKAGKTIFFWSETSKRKLIEDYFFNQTSGTAQQSA
ncbi:MAG: type I-E CRISPR-associated protein Cse2/CasB [Pontibacterium sp.]